MSTPFDDLIDKGLSFLSTHAGETVTYKRGLLLSATFTAVQGRTEWEELNAEGTLERFESKDFLFAAADLVLGGVAATPQKGDKIEITTAGKTLTFQVLPFGAEKQTWRYSDRQRKRMRVHTKLIEEA